MKNLSFFYLAPFLFIWLAGKGQNIPYTAKEIPVFPGVLQNEKEQKQSLQDYQEILDGEPLRELSVSVYSAMTIPDDVCRFYIEKLGATEGFPDDNSEPQISVNPWYEAGFFDDSWFEDQYEGNIKIQDGKWIKAALAERKQWKPGKWLQGAYFEWTVLLNNGDLARHFIDIIDDDSFDSRTKTVTNKTMITIVSQILESEGDED